MEINTSELFDEVMSKTNLDEVKEEKPLNNETEKPTIPTPDEVNLPSGLDDPEDFYYCEEEDLLEEVEDDFSYQIRERGRDYYNSGNIVLCCKNNNKYYAKVRGTNDKPYIVNVEITEDGVEYDCTCPCTFPCKHEYAVIMASTNQEYANILLKPELKEKKDN